MEEHFPDVPSQLLEVQSAFTEQAEHAGAGGAVQPQVFLPKLVLHAKPPQSAEVRQPSVHFPVVPSQFPVAQSLPWVQAPQRGAAPSAVQPHTETPKPVTLQLWLGQSALVLHPWVHKPPTGSQKPLWQSLFCPHIAQSGDAPGAVPHWQVPRMHAEPPQSTGVVQVLPNERLHC